MTIRAAKAATIRAEIWQGVPSAVEIGDRRAAIRAGIAALETGDILLIAGKGHESGEMVGDQSAVQRSGRRCAAALEGGGAVSTLVDHGIWPQRCAPSAQGRPPG